MESAFRRKLFLPRDSPQSVHPLSPQERARRSSSLRELRCRSRQYSRLGSLQRKQSCLEQSLQVRVSPTTVADPGNL